MERCGLEKPLDPNEANQLKDLAPPSFVLIRKAEKDAKKVDINKIISYRKSQYSSNNRNQTVRSQNFPSLEEVFSFDRILEELKIISKHIKDGENVSLRNKALFGGWIAVARMVYKPDKLIEWNNLP